MSKKKASIPVQTNKVNLPKEKVIYTNAFFERFAEQSIWHYAILIFLPFFIYIKSTGYQFIDFDDNTILKNNFPLFASLKNIVWAFKTDAFITLHGDYYRPMQTVMFFIDFFIGGERPWIYHLSSLIVHILTVVSLYTLLKKLSFRSLTALFVALIFGVHPLLGSAVSWVPSMGDLLIGLFGILLFHSFINYVHNFSKLNLVLCIVLFLLALFSKETAVLLPIILIIYYKFGSTETFQPKRLIPLIFSWLIAFVFYYILRSKVVTGTPPDYILGIKPFINNLPSIPIAIAKFLIPAKLSTMPLFDPLYTSLGVLILIPIVILMVRFIMKKQWLPVFGFVWFILLVLPPLFFKLFFSKYLLEYYEHRMYLPIIGLMIIVAYLFDNIAYNRNRKIYYFLPVVIIAIFSFLALLRSDDFKNSMAFFTNAASNGNADAYCRRGQLNYGERNFNDAYADFDKAVECSEEGYPPALYNRGKIKSEQLKDPAGAEQDFSKVVALDSNFIDAYISRANTRISLKNIVGAFQDIESAKHIDSNNAKVYYTLGKVYVNASDFNNAYKSFTKTVTIDSNLSEAYNDRAYVQYRLKDFNHALSDCNKAISLFPQFMNAYYNKGMIYLELNKPDVAVRTFDTTLALANNFYFGYFYRGMAKKQLKDMNGACDDWQQSVNLGFNMAQDTINKYCIKH